MSQLQGKRDPKSPWQDLNLTELVDLARDFEPDAHRGLGRAAILEILTNGKSTTALPSYRVDKYRVRIMQYLDANWERVEPLLNCPARSRDPRACFNCLDVQVAECSLNNPAIFKEKK